MDIKESLSNILKSTNDRLDKKSSTLIDQLHVIFEQFTKKTLHSVVDYQRKCQEVIRSTDHPYFFQACVDFILDNQHVLSQIDAQPIKQNKDQVVKINHVAREKKQCPNKEIDSHSEEGSWEIMENNETSNEKMATSQIVVPTIRLLRRPPPLKRSLLKSPSTTVPKTDWNLAMKSVESAFAVLEDMNEAGENNDGYQTKSQLKSLLLTSNNGNLASKTKIKNSANKLNNPNAIRVSKRRNSSVENKEQTVSGTLTNYHSNSSLKTSTSLPATSCQSTYGKTRRRKTKEVAVSDSQTHVLNRKITDKDVHTPSTIISGISSKGVSLSGNSSTPPGITYTPNSLTSQSVSDNSKTVNSVPSQSSNSRIKHPNLPKTTSNTSLPFLVPLVIDLTENQSFPKNNASIVQELNTSASSVLGSLVQTSTPNRELRSAENQKKEMPADVEIVKDNLLSINNMNTRTIRCTEVLQLFPDADPNHIEELLKNQIGPDAVNNVCMMLIDNPGYPKCQNHTIIKQVPSQKPPPQINYFEECNKSVNIVYRDEVARKLQNDFRFVSVRDITSIMKYYNDYYAPSYKVLAEAMDEVLASNTSSTKNTRTFTVKMEKGGEVKTVNSTFLKSKRALNVFDICNDLQKEIDFVVSMTEKAKLDADAEIAWKLNEEEYEMMGENIECLCCYGSSPFENMVQCFDGHLFCKMCLQNYVKEAVYGSGKLTLSCMTGDCESTFPESQLESALTKEMMDKYQDRVREENLNLANLENLVRCPGCDYAAVLDAGMKVFECGNIYCLKTTCRYCKEDWKDHVGIPCSELEKKDEATLRKDYEEKMTAAKVRTCHKCKSKFMKEDGCNKMTCRCKATMCYICRQPNISYKHFCQHVRDPGKPCTQCKACSLWSNPDEDDKRAIAELQEEAQQKRKEMGFLEKKEIGALDAAEPPKKKLKTT